ncbi:MAG: D-alanyl-D-alanine carboxypeptidase/D-alanyl-D-alanine-endopeptidase [Desulfoprunum sp.]|nr:D-alanyl-D-alanine carboxypeptidase/D-alanyl-D-alanine-endopeptidase [Desulfoprunum sp.]
MTTCLLSPVPAGERRRFSTCSFFPMPFFSQPLRRVCLLLLPLLLLPVQGHGQTELAKLISHGGYAVTAHGAILRSHNMDVAFVPASTIKLVTCLAALKTLGADYRFKTTFFLDRNHNLTIKGSGDPYLTSDAVSQIAEELARQGLKQIRDIALDGSAFSVKDPADGTENSQNPYDAANGALAVNFNSIPITVLADHTVISGEQQTPRLPIMQEIGSRLAPGTYRLNSESFPARNPLPATLRYTGELFKAMFERQGIKVTGKIIAARTAGGMQPFFTYTSEKPVEDLVRSCLQYSNNFLANQLFLACGAERHGWPATWQKGRKAMQAFINTTWPKDKQAIIMIEGSGLSRKDQISPAAMLAVLETFKPYADLLKSKDGIPLKSGTMADVYCYAGYFPHDNDTDPFVIMLNQRENSRDELLALLRQVHAERH